MADEIYKAPENPIYNVEIKKIQDEDPVSASEVLNPVLEQIIENTAAVKELAEESSGGQGRMYVESDGCVTIPTVKDYEDMADIPYTIMPTSHFKLGWPFVEQDFTSSYGRQGGVTTHACISPDKEYIVFGGPVQPGVSTLSAVKLNGSLDDYEVVSLFDAAELPGTVTDMAMSGDGKLLVVTHDKSPKLSQGDEFLCLSMYLKNEDETFSRMADPLSKEESMSGPRVERTTSVKFQPGGSLFVVTCIQGGVAQPCIASIYRYDSGTGAVSYVRDLFPDETEMGVYGCDWSEDGTCLALAVTGDTGAPRVFYIEDDGLAVAAVEIPADVEGFGGELYSVKFIPGSSPAALICSCNRQYWGSPYFYIDETWWKVTDHDWRWNWYSNSAHNFQDLSASLYFPQIVFTGSWEDNDLRAVVTFYDQKPSVHKYERRDGRFSSEDDLSKWASALYGLVPFDGQTLLALMSGGAETVSFKTYRHTGNYENLNINNLGPVSLWYLELVGDIISGAPFTILYDPGAYAFFVHNNSKDEYLLNLSRDIEELQSGQELLPGTDERTLLHNEKDYTVTIDSVTDYVDMADKPYWIKPAELSEYPVKFSYHYDEEATGIFEDLQRINLRKPMFRPDGRYFFVFPITTSAETSPEPVHVYEVGKSYSQFTKLDSRNIFDIPPKRGALNVAMSPDGKILVLGYIAQSESVMFYRANEDMSSYIKMADPAAEIRTGRSVYGICFSPDGRYLCVVSANASTETYREELIVLYDYDSEKGTLTFNRSLSNIEGVLTDEHTFPIRCSWSPDSRYLVVSCYYGEKSIIVFDAEKDFATLDYNYTREDNTSGNYRVIWALFDPSTEGPRKYRIYCNSADGTFPLGSGVDNASFYQIDAETNSINRLDLSEIGMTDSGGNGSYSDYMIREPVVTPDGQWLIWMEISRYPTRIYRILPDGTMKQATADCFSTLRTAFNGIGFAPDNSVAVGTANSVAQEPSIAVMIHDPLMDDAYLDVNGLGNKPVVLAGGGQIDENIPALVSFDQSGDCLVIENPSQGALVRELSEKTDTFCNVADTARKDVKTAQADAADLTATVDELAKKMEKINRILKVYPTEEI